MNISKDRWLGRAKNSMLAFLEKRLFLPKIYLNALWAGHEIDVLAIDRDGAGEVHAVLLFLQAYFDDHGINPVHELHEVKSCIERFGKIPANYKYIAVVSDESEKQDESIRTWQTFLEESFSLDGIGRIGYLKVQMTLDGETSIEMKIKPERFRAQIAVLADEFIERHAADWEIRA